MSKRMSRFKRKGQSKFKRKGQPRFKRKWNPTCYVCKRQLQELHDIKVLREEEKKTSDQKIGEQIDKLLILISKRIICVGLYKNGTKILRHNSGYCEPGGENYMKDPELAAGYIRFARGAPEERRWWEDLPNVIKDDHTNV